jgi:hypothetical protein
MNNIDKRKLIPFIILAALTLVGVGIAIFGSLNTSTVDDLVTDETPQNSLSDIYENNIIRIKDLDQVSPNSDPQTKLNAQRTLFRYALQDDLEDSKIEYEGEIRENSFSRTSSNNSITERMIVDIPEIKQSWGLVYIWSQNEPIMGDHIFPLCLENDQMKYGTFECNSNFGKYKDY